MHSICASVLRSFYEDSGPNQGPPVLMLHGWPDAPRGWSAVAAKLNDRGWRTIIPYLRGSRPTRFLSPDNTRFGSGVALAQDAIDLADKLGLDRFAVVGKKGGSIITAFNSAVRAMKSICIRDLPCQPHP